MGQVAAVPVAWGAVGTAAVAQEVWVAMAAGWEAAAEMARTRPFLRR